MLSLVSKQADFGMLCQATVNGKNHREVSPAFEISSWGYCLGLKKPGYAVG